MKRTIVRLATLLVLLIPVSGCIKFQEELVLLPDGSGKMVLTFSTNIAMMEKAKQMGGKMEDKEKNGLGPEDLENTEGFVAFTRPKMEKKDGWNVFTVTGYFEDIGKVKLYDDKGGEKKAKFSFSFKREGDGCLLEVLDGTLGQGEEKEGEDLPPEMGDAIWKGMKDFFKGFEISRSVKMPGPVTVSDGFTSKEGRTAQVKITEEQIKSFADMQKVMKPTKRKVGCDKSEMSEEEVAAFRKELEAAKAEWPKIREELKEEAEKKKKEQEKKDD